MSDVHDQVWDHTRCVAWLTAELVRQRRKSRPRDRREWRSFLQAAGLPVDVLFLLFACEWGHWQAKCKLYGFLAEEIRKSPTLSWNAESRELFLGGELVHRFRSDFDLGWVLDMFENKRWPSLLRVLFDTNYDAREAAARLNRSLAGVRFYAKGQGLRWELRT